ncbi:toxin-antitoxin system YwqK family antitoxin [Bacteroidota bacterium]
MKNLVLLFFIAFSVLRSYAQTDTIWFDKEWKTQVQDSATFFRVANLKEERFKEFFHFKDYNLKGEKLKEGVSLKKTEDVFVGEVIYFFQDGSVSERIVYKNGFRFGDHKTYYESGKLKTIKSYLFGELKGPSRTYNEDGTLLESGVYIKNEREGVWKVYYKNGKLKEQGLYKKGLRVGIWKTYYYNGTSQE